MLHTNTQTHKQTNTHTAKHAHTRKHVHATHSYCCTQTHEQTNIHTHTHTEPIDNVAHKQPRARNHTNILHVKSLPELLCRGAEIIVQAFGAYHLIQSLYCNAVSQLQAPDTPATARGPLVCGNRRETQNVGE